MFQHNKLLIDQYRSIKTFLLKALGEMIQQRTLQRPMEPKCNKKVSVPSN